MLQLDQVFFISPLTLLNMINKQSQYVGDSFIKQIASRLNSNDVDPRRIKRITALKDNDGAGETNNVQIQMKMPVKFHKFREDARKNHRQMTQQNHDFMKMTQAMTKSVLDNDRFKFLVGGRSNKNKDVNESNVNNRESLQMANLNLNFNIQINSSLIQSKIDIRKIYEIFPYKKLSIQMQPNSYLNPAFQFFLFWKDNSKSVQLQNNLSQIIDEGLASDIRLQITQLTYYLDYFDYIHFIRFLFSKNQGKDEVESKYPRQILQMARNTHKMQASSDEEQDFNKDQIIIDAANSFHRVFQCDETQLSKPFDSIYFPDLQDYENYKKLRQIQYKNLKIEAEDIVIYTDVRNIISSEKIYLINIIQEIQLSIQLLKTNRQTYLMKNLHSTMIRKIYEYLHLVGGYTKSTILVRFNIADPYSKIYQFLYKSIIYGKPYEKIDRKILDKYPVLQIWYNLPDKIHGYARQEIHNALYRLIEATIQFQKKIKQIQQYQGLKIKHYDRQYLQSSK